MKCQPYTSEGNVTSFEWLYIDPITEVDLLMELPQCVYFCEDNPPEDESIYNRTWREGYKGIGEIANYVCLGNIY